MALHYEIKNRSSRNVEFVLTPFFQFVPKGADLLPDQEIVFTKGAVESEGMTLHLRTNGMIKEIAETEEVYFYRYDVCDGRRAYGHARANHQIRLQAEAGKQVVLEVVYEMEPSKNSAQTIIEQTKARQKTDWRNSRIYFGGWENAFKKCQTVCFKTGIHGGRYDFGRIPVLRGLGQRYDDRSSGGLHFHRTV